MSPAQKQNNSPPTVGFVGGGMMATALMKSLVSGGFLPASNVLVVDPSTAATDRVKIIVGEDVNVLSSAVDLASKCDFVFLAVKPQYVQSVCSELASLEPNEYGIVISIAAGVTLNTIEGAIARDGARVVRVMPNMPCLVGEMAAGYIGGTNITEEEIQSVGTLLNACGGISMRVGKESLLDGVTGVSGSGPAYIFLVIEALADGGVKAGLARPVALKLAAQVVKGAATMVLETGSHPGVLKDQICSPGGTTIEAVEFLEKSGVRYAFAHAVDVVVQKSRALGKM